jgi:transposase
MKPSNYLSKHSKILGPAQKGIHPQKISELTGVDSQRVREIMSYARRVGVSIKTFTSGPKPDINPIVEKLIKEGKSREEIMQRTGVSKERISKVSTLLRRNKTMSIPKNRGQKRREFIKRLYSSGLSTRQMSLLTGISLSNVSRQVTILVNQGEIVRRKTKSRYLKTPAQKTRLKNLKHWFGAMLNSSPKIKRFLSEKKGKTYYEKIITFFGEEGFNGKNSPENNNLLSQKLASATNTSFVDAQKLVSKAISIFFFEG